MCCNEPGHRAAVTVGVPQAGSLSLGRRPSAVVKVSSQILQAIAVLSSTLLICVSQTTPKAADKVRERQISIALEARINIQLSSRDLRWLKAFPLKLLSPGVLHKHVEGPLR